MLEALYLIILIINIGFSFLLLFNIKKNRPNILFFISSLFISIWMATQYLRLDSDYVLFWSRLALICSSIYPATILLFILDYPKKVINLTPKIISIILLPSAISAYFATTPQYITAIINSKEFIKGNGYLFFGIGFICYSLCVLGIALYGMKTYKGLNKKKVQYFFYGLLISLVLGITTNIILPNLGVIEFLHIGPIFVTIFTLTNIFSILKNQLFDIHIIVGKYLAHFFTISLVSIIYISHYWISFILFKQTNSVSFIIASFSVFIMLPLYNYIKVKLQSSAEKFFLKGFYDYKKVLLNFSKKSSEISKTDELLDYIYTLFIEEVEISPMYILIPKCFDKFKEISKTLTFYPPKNIKSTSIIPELTQTQIRLIEKNKKTILTEEDIKSMNLNLNSDCKLILNCFDTEHNIICLIIIGQKMIGSNFSNEDITLLTTLSNQISLNLLRIKELRLTSQIEIAQKIQTEIIPQHQSIPNCDISTFMKSSDEVGGDFYDIHSKNDDCWIILGDVAGHGIGSGMIMLMIQSIFSTIIHSSDITDPAILNKLANKVLCKHFERLTEPRPISLVTLHTKDGKHFKIHGNHENVYQFKKENDVVDHIPVHDIPLGIGLTEELDDSCFISNNITLNQDDILLLTTDGLTEAYKNGNLDNEQYEDKRIINLLKKHSKKTTSEIKSKIIKSINDFTNKVFQDDMTFIILKGNNANQFTTIQPSGKIKSIS